MFVGGFHPQWTSTPQLLPSITTPIYQDFSKILFEYENSYHRPFEETFFVSPGHFKVSKIDQGKFSVSQA